MSPVAPSGISSGLKCVKWSQIDSPLPPSFQPPSIWYDELPTPKTKSSGNLRPDRADLRCGNARKWNSGKD